MTRADVLLVAKGLAPSRSAAQRLIERGAVQWRGHALRKAGTELPDDASIELSDDAEIRWASRSGLKLDAALLRTGLDPAAMRCLDLGQSTGGFTDVLLARGAKHVVGVEVGHGQLLARLASDSRVQTLEKLDARAFDGASAFELVVGDLSFISQTLVIASIVRALTASGQVLMLVKPQFELQPADIGKGGLVTRPEQHARVESRIRQAYNEAGLQVIDYFESAVTGGDGNREFFVHARRGRPSLEPHP